MPSRFSSKDQEDLYNGVTTPATRKILPRDLVRIAYRKITLILNAQNLPDLAVPRGNGLEALKKGRRGQHAIRINDKYRVCFVWTPEGATQIEVTDYHDD
jgi:proteic killer suppression protein